MGVEKNIIMKQFNGTDYDILYPKTIASQIPDVYSKTEVLTSETLTKYGLTADKLPNDVFQQIKVLIDNVQDGVDSRTKIQTGSYVGTGTYGSSAPCSLTFDFVPKLVIIQGTGTASSISDDYKIVALNGINTASSRFFENLNTNVGWFLMVAVTWNGNTMQWYALDGYHDVKASSSSQLNSNNNTYYYIALG